MNCCINCFTDQGLQDRIKAESETTGDCNFCESKDVVILSCEKTSDLFESLFDQYTNHPTSELSLKEAKPFLLHEHLNAYWPRLFNRKLLKLKDVRHLVNQIGKAWTGFNESLFDDPIELQLYVDGTLSVETYSSQWDQFAQEIKEQNRFFISQTLDLELLGAVLARFAKTYNTGTEFFRARISDTPLPEASLGKPPKEKATSGRANPVGIPYLYISDRKETTLHEARASLHDSISIGKFVLKSPLQVISLKNIANFGPFEIQDKGFEIDEFMHIRPYLLKLEQELSTPIRKRDANLDYLPTQYLCEFIKSEGFDAIEYRSAMVEGGYNLAVFNDRNLECVESDHYQVKKIKYEWS